MDRVGRRNARSLVGTNKIVPLRDYRAACIRRAVVARIFPSFALVLRLASVDFSARIGNRDPKDKSVVDSYSSQ